MDIQTHTSYTEKEICNHILEGRKLIKRLKLQQKVKKNPKRYSSQHLLKETMKKCSMLVSNTSLFNGCLPLICFIVTTLIIDSVYFDDIKPGGGGVQVLSCINLIDISLKSCQDQESWTTQPHYDFPQIPPLPAKKMNVFYKLGWPQVAQLTSLVFAMQ